MHYRIRQKFYRNSGTGEQKSYFIVEYLGTTFLRRLFHLDKKWITCKMTVCYEMDSYKKEIEFDNFEVAEKYIKNSKIIDCPDVVTLIN